MLSSRVKISCLGAKAHLVFHWCLYNKHQRDKTKRDSAIKQNLSRDILLLLRDKIKCVMSSMGHGTITNITLSFVSFLFTVRLRQEVFFGIVWVVILIITIQPLIEVWING